MCIIFYYLVQKSFNNHSKKYNGYLIGIVTDFLKITVKINVANTVYDDKSQKVSIKRDIGYT